MATKRAAKPAPKSPKTSSKSASKRPTAAAEDPTSDAALLALAPTYAAAPDMPVSVAIRELASLARLAGTEQAALGKVGITAERIDLLARYSRRLDALEKGWRKARGAVKLTPAQHTLRDEAEALDTKLLAGGRWACRKDAAAQEELSRIAEGSGLADTIQDLVDLVAFWAEHEAELGATDITKQDLARASTLADLLEEAAANEASDLDAARAMELRDRAFWAADEHAKEIREGGRYAFRGAPKIAAKFVSRYRASASRRARRKAKQVKAKPVAPKSGTP